MEDAVKRKVFKWYKKIRESRWFYEVIYAGLLIPVLFDLVPMQYCSRVMEEFFQKAGDAYAVISGILIAVWVFIGTLLVFWLGMFKEKRYGIPNVDIIFTNISVKKRAALIGIYMLELMELYLSVTYNWEITLAVLPIILFVSVVYIFAAICLEPSATNFRDTVKGKMKKDIQENAQVTGIILKLVKNIKYAEEDLCLDSLVTVIGELNADDMSEELEENIRDYVAKIVDAMIKANGKEEGLTDIIREYLCGQKVLSAQCGVMRAALDNVEMIGFDCFSEKILNIKYENRRRVLIWGLVYNGYHMKYEGQEYRRMLTDQFWEILEHRLNVEEEQFLNRCWDGMSEKDEDSRMGNHLYTELMKGWIYKE